MKYILSLLIILCVLAGGEIVAQDTTKVNTPKKDSVKISHSVSDTTNVRLGSGNVVTVVDDHYGTEVVVGREGGIIVDEREDTVRIKIGKKGIKIVESGSGTKVEIIDVDDFEREFRYRPKRRFRGHWSGFELGMNYYMTGDFKWPNDYMALSSNNSWNVNFNILQFSLNISKQSIGLVTGLGFQLNDYKFRGPNTIGLDGAGNVIELPLPGSVAMSKFHVDYLTIPLIMEFHLNPHKYGRRLYIGAGIIGSFKLRSYTRMRYTSQDTNYDVKKFDDLSVSPLQTQATFRIGFKCIKIFANYNITPMFQHNPTLYPYSVGLVLLGF